MPVRIVGPPLLHKDFILRSRDRNRRGRMSLPEAETASTINCRDSYDGGENLSGTS